MGEALKQMAEVKFALEDNVKQNFLEPLTHLQNKDVRDVMVSRPQITIKKHASGFNTIYHIFFYLVSITEKSWKAGDWTLIVRSVE